MSYRIVGLVLCAALPAGCARVPAPVCQAPGHLDDGSCRTSMLNIIASPRSYDGRKVTVAGFVDIVGDGDRRSILLYPSREARALEATTAAVRVRAEGRPLDRIRGRDGTDIAAWATGTFTQAGAGQGVLGEISAGP